MNEGHGAIVKSKILHAAAKLFLNVGYQRASIVKIAEEANVNRGSICFAFKDKESILCELVALVIEAQFEAVSKLLEGIWQKVANICEKCIM